jgi:hypothetical protein
MIAVGKVAADELGIDFIAAKDDILHALRPVLTRGDHEVTSPIGVRTRSHRYSHPMDHTKQGRTG